MKLPKICIAVTFLLILAGCPKRPAESVVKEHAPADSAAIVPDPHDTLSYIGYVERFKGTDLFFTEIFYKSGAEVDFDNHDALMALGGTEVYKTDEVSRTRVEVNQVGNFFDLTGMNTITIYNRKNEKLTTGRLSHIEYVEDPIENKFVAVFQVDQSKLSGPWFCVGNSSQDLTPVQVAPFVDLELNKRLTAFLKLDQKRVLNVKHYKLENESGRQVYSTISADTTAYIVDTTTEKYQLLYKSSFQEMIIDLDPVSRIINGRIMLLIFAGQPDTDNLWSSLLVFDGKGYRVVKGNRVSRGI